MLAYVVVASMCVFINPLISLLTMSKIRFFIRKDFQVNYHPFLAFGEKVMIFLHPLYCSLEIFLGLILVKPLLGIRIFLPFGEGNKGFLYYIQYL